MRLRIFLISLGLALLATPLSAQLGLPQVQLPQIGNVIDPVTGQVLQNVEVVADRTTRRVVRLARLRDQRIDRLVRRNRDTIEFDNRGEPARRGELLLIDANERAIEVARTLGFSVIATEEIKALEINVTRLSIPEGESLDDAQNRLGNALPETEISADNLHFQSGEVPVLPMLAQSSIERISVPVGVIDGGAVSNIASIKQQGFAEGAPLASNHGSAVASLLHYAGVGDIRLADVYGTDKAGGNALAIAKALAWLVQDGSKVINISLVGPENTLVERAISRAQASGILVVAAVGNDGPAAPPAYPASYSGVLAVTAVDRRNRALIEAGRALHLDYAAPGADIYGDGAAGQRLKLRGTSFATPLVAARLAAALDAGANWRSRLDGEAKDLGPKGPDAVFGRGLLCGNCRPKK